MEKKKLKKQNGQENIFSAGVEPQTLGVKG